MPDMSFGAISPVRTHSASLPHGSHIIGPPHSSAQERTESGASAVSARPSGVSSNAPSSRCVTSPRAASARKSRSVATGWAFTASATFSLGCGPPASASGTPSFAAA